MTDIGDLFQLSKRKIAQEQHKRICDDTLVGVEVEIENVTAKVPNYVHTWWEVVNDGSLRNNGLEFKFAQPYGGANIISALDALSKFCQTFNPDMSERTSDHVHVDARELQPPQILKWILLYAMFERPLFRFCGPERYDNIFCGSIESCEGISDILAYLSKNNEDGIVESTRFGNERGKYSSINLQTLNQFGTIEFRGHRGTFDSDEIITWINILLKLRKYAVETTHTPERLLELPSFNGGGNVAKEVFGEEYPKLVYADIDRDVLEGVRTAQDILYSYSLDKIKTNVSFHKTKDKEKDTFRKFLVRKNSPYLAGYDEQMGYTEATVEKKRVRSKFDMLYKQDIV